jgi:hypothetical protein
MTMAAALKATVPEGWETISTRMRVVRLTIPLQVLVPALAVSALSKNTRGLTLYPGRAGAALGVLLMAASAIVSALLQGPIGVAGPVLSVWVLGTAGGAIFWASLTTAAFVKPICVRCRLLPIIREHEALHLSGVAGEGAVWKSMKTRHSIASLSLEGDPAICSFCPIPKRLSER